MAIAQWDLLTFFLPAPNCFLVEGVIFGRDAHSWRKRIEAQEARCTVLFCVSVHDVVIQTEAVEADIPIQSKME
jgi:hypothetical protein